MKYPETGFLEITRRPIPPSQFTGEVPEGMERARVTHTIDQEALHADFPNIDLVAYDYPRPGLADQIWISVLAERGNRDMAALSLTLHDQEVFGR